MAGAAPPVAAPPRVKNTLPSIDGIAIVFHDVLELVLLLVVDDRVVDVWIKGAKIIFSFLQFSCFDVDDDEDAFPFIL